MVCVAYVIAVHCDAAVQYSTVAMRGTSKGQLLWKQAKQSSVAQGPLSVLAVGGRSAPLAGGRR